MTKVAVTSRTFSCSSTLREELLAIYPDCTFNDSSKNLDGDDLVDFLRGHNRAIIALNPIDKKLLGALPELEVIAKFGVGFDQLDLQAMIEHGVRLGWEGGVNRRSVSELVVGFSILLLRKIKLATRIVSSGTWKQVNGRQLSDCTVGIIGCGCIGKDLGRILRNGFNCRVLAHDIRPFPEYYKETGVEPVALDILINASDIVTLHLPYDSSTKNILDRKRLAKIKHSAIIINTARSGLVDESAIKTLLKSGKLGGVAFDVFSVEPPDDPELLSLDNFVLTPHIGGSTKESILNMGRAAIRGLEKNHIPKKGLFPFGF